MVTADGMSRLPLQESPAFLPQPGETVMLIETPKATPVNALQIKKWIEKILYCPVFILQGWSQVMNGGIQAIFPMRRMGASFGYLVS